VVIRHDSAVPVYRQLAAMLREDIESGQLAPGMPLPSESSLTQEHGISRDSVRRAMDVLREEGLVITVQGKGTYVRERPGRRSNS
jgi:DNA-binding GntR family transcriptional regulator